MKKITIGILGFLLFSITACTKDKGGAENVDEASVKNALVARPYHISYFYEGGMVRTDDFAGVNFTFTSAGSIAATNNIATFTGTYTTGTVPNFTTVNINFASPTSYQRLTKAWQVYTNMNGRINMQYPNTNGVIDQLIIEQ